MNIQYMLLKQERTKTNDFEKQTILAVKEKYNGEVIFLTIRKLERSN